MTTDRIQTLHSFALQARRPFSGFALPSYLTNVLVLLLDVVALLLAYKMAIPVAAEIVESFKTSSLESFYQTNPTHLVTGFILSLGILISFFLNGHYTKRIPWWCQTQLISKTMIFAFLIVGFSAFILGLHYSRILIIVYWALAFGFLILSRLTISRIRIHTASWKLPTVIIGDIPTITDTLFAIDSDRSLGYEPKVVLLRDKAADSLDREDLPPRYRNIEIHDGISGYKQFIEVHPEYYYVISMVCFRGNKREALLNSLTEKSVKFALIPAISSTALYQSTPQYFFGNDVMLLGVKGNSLTVLDRFFKRSMDIAGALVGLTVFGIPMLLVAFMLKRDGQGGTLLYCGERIGQGGRRFCCWKFRTMEPNTDHLLQKYLLENPQAKSDWERYFKLRDDPRVQSRTAKFIRKASIDELPQLWNVLKGEMSLVGPRPLLPNEVEAYGDKYREYTSLKPGLTGLWQVSGRSGTSFHRRIIWDSWYVRNWSVWSDIVIIMKTVCVVLSRSGAS